MRLYVGVTDDDWFEFLAVRFAIAEINFWRPGGLKQFRSLGLDDRAIRAPGRGFAGPGKQALEWHYEERFLR